MPEVYCRFYNMIVDGGYCAFVCELPESEKRIVYNPFRGIRTGCSFRQSLEARGKESQGWKLPGETAPLQLLRTKK
ncbi:MAG: hypothetical protein ACTSSA_15565 [Candidatus Freyarchaeota archaeon]